MGTLRLALLGSPQITENGEEKVLRERKAIALLAYLAVEQKPQNRDTLATLLWPEHDQKRARANLRYLLWSLRKTFHGAWLRTEGDQVALVGGDELWVDVVAFRQSLAAWRTGSHPAGEDGPVCVASLQQAVEVYRGNFLQGFSLDDSPAFDDWQFFQSEELNRQLADALAALVDQLMACGAYDAAIDHARRWLALDPLHEPATCALMKLYTWTGRHKAAIRQFHQCVQTLADELGVEPAPETRHLYAQIRNRQFPLPQGGQPDETAAHTLSSGGPPTNQAGNLPPESTPFVGREEELAQIARALANPVTRLLTVVGPGGIGKTSLALQAGRAAIPHFAGGVWFVACANLQSPAHVPAAILSTLGIAVGGDISPVDVLFAQLRTAQTLLILDNFEDVLSAAAFVADLLRACPHVKLLVTTRERLNLQEEQLLPLDSLDYPSGDANIKPDAAPVEYSALRLFEICAQRMQPAFVLNASNLASVIHICQLVEGTPLALEMAASWTHVLPVADIQAEIARSVAFLSSSARNVESRHRSIHAVFDHSWQMLTEGERSVVRQLSVFRNGFTRGAAESVAGASLLDLSALLDKSWLQLTSSGRYQMHRLAREYALEKLHAEHPACTGESMADVLRRHSLYYAALVPDRGIYAVPLGEVENVKLAWQTTLDQREWQTLERLAIPLYDILQRWWNREILPMVEDGIRRLDAELKANSAGEEERQDSIRVALARTLATAGEYHIHLGYIVQSIDYLNRGRTLLAEEWQQSEAKGLAYAQITRILGFAVYYHGEFARAAALYEDALSIYTQIRPFEVPYTLLLLAQVYERVGRYDDAEKCLYPPAGGQWVPDRHEPTRLRMLGRVLTRQGRYSEAKRMLEESYPATVHRYRAHTLIDLGMAQRGDGQIREAIETFQQGLVITEETGDRPAQSDLLLELGFTLLQIGEADIAQNHLRHSLTIAEAVERQRNIALGEMGLGLADMQRGEMESAQNHLVQALLAETTLNAPPDALNILTGVGAFHAAEREPEAAAAVLEIVRLHPATSAETRSRALGLRRTLGADPGCPESRLSWEEADLGLQAVVRDTLTRLQTRREKQGG